MADITINRTVPSTDAEGDDYVMVVPNEGLVSPDASNQVTNVAAENNPLRVVALSEIRNDWITDADINVAQPHNERTDEAPTRQAVAEAVADAVSAIPSSVGGGGSITDQAIDVNNPSNERTNLGASRQAIAEMADGLLGNMVSSLADSGQRVSNTFGDRFNPYGWGEGLANIPLASIPLDANFTGNFLQGEIRVEDNGYSGGAPIQARARIFRGAVHIKTIYFTEDEFNSGTYKHFKVPLTTNLERNFSYTAAVQGAGNYSVLSSARNIILHTGDGPLSADVRAEVSRDIAPVQERVDGSYADSRISGSSLILTKNDGTQDTLALPATGLTSSQVENFAKVGNNSDVQIAKIPIAGISNALFNSTLLYEYETTAGSYSNQFPNHDTGVNDSSYEYYAFDYVSQFNTATGTQILSGRLLNQSVNGGARIHFLSSHGNSTNASLFIFNVPAPVSSSTNIIISNYRVYLTGDLRIYGIGPRN